MVEKAGIGEELEAIHGVGCSPVRTWYRDGEGVEREEEKETGRRKGSRGAAWSGYLSDGDEELQQDLVLRSAWPRKAETTGRGGAAGRRRG